jgi:hypothetical protein
MARSGHGAREVTVAIIARGSSGPTPQPGAAGRGNKAVLGLVVLGLVRHVLRSRRFYQRVATAVITLGALRGIGQENRASMTARLSAWNKRQMQRLEHEAERQARTVKGAGRMARSGPPRGLAAILDADVNGVRKA